MKKNNRGFTLAELLIVVAIIAVLVAIAIPVFTSQLEKAREGVDAANIRSAYAEVVAARMGAGSAEYYKDTVIKQKTGGWITANDFPENLYDSSACTTALKDSTTFKPTDSDTVYIVSNGEGKAYVTTTAPTTAVDVDTLG